MTYMRPMSEAPTDGTWIELWHAGHRYKGGPVLGNDGEPIVTVGWVKGRAYAEGGDGDHYWECPEVDDDYTICFDGWRPMTDWQPIETAPKDGTRFIVGEVGDPDPEFARFVSNEWVDPYGDKLPFEPTHWKPSPDPPKD